MVYAKMGFALSIKTAADQNHKPTLRALTFRKNEIFSQILAWVSGMAQGSFLTIEASNRWAQLESRRNR